MGNVSKTRQPEEEESQVREHVIPAAHALKADASRALSAAQVREAQVYGAFLQRQVYVSSEEVEAEFTAQRAKTAMNEQVP